MTDKAADILETLAFLDDWEERYSYIIDLGKSLPPLAESDKTQHTKVQGCQSQVWIKPIPPKGSETILRFQADSDALIVKGLAAVLLALYENKTAPQILETDPLTTLKELGLKQHLSSNRANGLNAMNTRIQAYAAHLIDS